MILKTAIHESFNSSFDASFGPYCKRNEDLKWVIGSLDVSLQNPGCPEMFHECFLYTQDLLEGII